MHGIVMVETRPLKEVLVLHDSGVWAEEDPQNGVSVLRSTNFQSDGRLDLTRLTLRAIPAADRSGKRLSAGDILLEKSGGGPKQPVGRVAFFDGDSQEHAFGNFIARLRANPQVCDARYVFYFLLHLHLTGQTTAYQKQTTGIRNLEFNRYLDLVRVPVPTLVEQRRITDILSRAEGIMRLRRQAVRLASELVPSYFIDMVGDPASNPKGWPTKPLVELADFLSGATPSKASSEYWNGDIPWVSAKDMKAVSIKDTQDHVTQAALDKTNLKLVRPRSVLIVVRGMILLHTVPIAICERPVTVNQDLKAISPSDVIPGRYLLWTLRTMHSALLAMVSTASHGTKKIELDRLQSLPIPVPPTELLNQFEARCQSVQSIIGQTQAAAKRAEELCQTLLHRAFRSAI